MTGPVFVDVNIFIYARQSAEPLKRALAIEWFDRLWLERRGRTSIQVLNETYTILTRKLQPPLTHEDAWRYVGAFFSWNPCGLDTEIIHSAREIERRYQLNWWDCLIIAAAQAQGCSTLLNEHLDDQGIYAGVRVCNPFRMAICDAA
jgi:predicted nucleic acid-binding protein